ncbi:gamma-glutamyltransferase family protein, partial [Enterobacter sp. DRP3]|nr:gamma-glutamyltransferase family protein [Enterobacter sp. DRP3]
TYTRILDGAHAAATDRNGRIDAALAIWYRGFVADEIDAYYTHEAVRDTTGQRNRGLLRKADLADWRARYDDPVTLQYGRYTVAKGGVWSQGPVPLQQRALLRHL